MLFRLLSTSISKNWIRDQWLLTEIYFYLHFFIVEKITEISVTLISDVSRITSEIAKIKINIINIISKKNLSDYNNVDCASFK